MNDFRRTTDQFKVQGNQLMDKVRQIVDEGNARRIIIKTENRTLIEFPLTVGVGGAIAAVVLAPVFAAIGAIAALVSDVEIVVERDADHDGTAEESRSYRPADMVRNATDRAQGAARDFAGKARTAATDVKHDAQDAAQTVKHDVQDAARDARDKTIGTQPTDLDTSWSPTHEDRDTPTPPAM